MDKQLMLEYMPFSATALMIQESRDQHNGRVLIKGVLQRSDAQNQNGRVYPHDILTRECDKYAGTFIKEQRALGELDHPDSSVVNLANVSHRIVEMHFENKDVVGTVEVLPTPAGKILEALLAAGVQIGISSRGLGSVSENTDGGHVVQDDFELIAFDMVSNPSTQGAFMHPLKESVDKYGQMCVDRYCRIQELITEILIDFNEKPDIGEK